jgi:hypothetical protein
MKLRVPSDSCAEPDLQAKGNRDLKIPALVALYTFDHNCVIILSLPVKLPTL